MEKPARGNTMSRAEKGVIMGLSRSSSYCPKIVGLRIYVGRLRARVSAGADGLFQK